MTMPGETSSDLQQSLARLEECLETPLVPGELEAWIKTLRQAVGAFGPLFRRQVGEVHAAELSEIGSEDPELFGRVNELLHEDERNLQRFQFLERSIETLSELISEIEPDETRFKQHVDDLVEEGLQFVIAVRRQEVAIRTWLQEAFNRDRGDVD